MFPPHCVAGSGEEEVVPELPGSRAGTLVRKHTFSGFQGHRPGRRPRAARSRPVEVAGVCTDICVLHTVFDLGARLRRRRAQGLVETYDAPGHDAEEFNRFALEHIRDVLGARVEWRSVVGGAPLSLPSSRSTKLCERRPITVVGAMRAAFCHSRASSTRPWRSR